MVIIDVVAVDVICVRVVLSWVNDVVLALVPVPATVVVPLLLVVAAEVVAAARDIETTARAAAAAAGLGERNGVSLSEGLDVGDGDGPATAVGLL